MSEFEAHGPSIMRLFSTKTKELGRSIPTLRRGNKGKIRSSMPQIDDTAGFVSWLKEQGINVVRETVAVGSLKPTQRHFDTKKVQGMAMNAMKGEFPKIRAAIIVSRDKRILDGHHRWVALRSMSPRNTMEIDRAAVGIDELIQLARQYGARTAKLYKTAQAFLGAMQ